MLSNKNKDVMEKDIWDMRDKVKRMRSFTERVRLVVKISATC